MLFYMLFGGTTTQMLDKSGAGDTVKKSNEQKQNQRRGETI